MLRVKSSESSIISLGNAAFELGRPRAVAVPGDPVADVKLMTKVNFVMKDGKVYKN